MSSKKSYLKNAADIGSATSEMLTLEPRIMLDAAAVATAVVALPIAPVDASAADSSGGHAPAAEAAPSSDTAAQDSLQNVTDPAAHFSDHKEPTVELIFVDPNIKNVDALLKELHTYETNHQDSSMIIKIIELNAKTDGIQQITSTISQYQNVSSVQIYSEANSGAVMLGTSILLDSNIDLYSQHLQSWSTSLSQNADILFYGCNIAESAEGISMLNKIANYTTADVAASIDLTGQANLGGNYVLEFHTGSIEATNVLSHEFMTNWNTTLSVSGGHGYSYTEQFPDGVITPGEQLTITYSYFISDTQAGTSYGFTFNGNIGYPTNMSLISTNLGPFYNWGGSQSGLVTSGSIGPVTISGSFFVTAIMQNPVPVGVENVFTSSYAELTYSSQASGSIGLGAVGLTLNFPVISNPEIAVTKTLTTVGPVSPGDQVHYDVLVTNTGNQNANVTVIETLPNGLILAAIPANSIWTSIGGGQYQANITNLSGYTGSTTLSLTLEVASAVPVGVESATNTVTVSTAEDPLGGGSSGNPANNTSTSASIAINAAPDIQITKTNNAGGSLDPGEQITYTINVANIGNQNAAGIVLTETLAPGLIFNSLLSPGWSQIGLTNQYTLTVPTSNVGSSQNFQFVADVVPIIPVGINFIQNTVSASPVAEDSNPTNDTFTDTPIPINAAPDLVVTKVITNTVNPTLLPGDTIDYLITVTNTGNQAATGIVITESSQGVLEAFGSYIGWIDQGNYTYTFDLTGQNLDGNLVAVIAGNGILEPGESSTIVYQTRLVNPQPATIESLMNTVSVTDTSGIDQNLANNTFTSTAIPIDAEPDLVISKDDSSDNVNAITPVIYHITVSNLGDQNTTGVVIQETLPLFTVFDPTLSTPGWVSLGGGVYEFALSALGPAYANDQLTTNSPVVIDFALIFADNVPQDLHGITNTVTVRDNTLSGIDRSISNNSTSDSTFAVISTDGIFHARIWNDYFDAGRYDQLSERYDYMSANDIINLASVTNINANLVGSRQPFSYDSVFGVINFDNEHSLIGRHASIPAITEFLVSDVMKNFPGNSLYMGSMSSNDHILSDANHLSDQIGQALEQVKVTDTHSDAHQALLKQHNAANDPEMYHGFNEQVLQIANRFEQESVNLSNAINRLMKP